MTDERRSKQRVKDEARLELVIQTAERFIIEKGFGSLIISDLIKETSIQRNAFYKLIPNVNTLITYMAIKGYNHAISFAERALKCEEKQSRQKVIAIFIGHMLFMKRYPILNSCIYEANMLTHRSQVPEQINALYDTKQSLAIDYVKRQVSRGILEGELVIPKYLAAEDVAMFLYSGSMGIKAMEFSPNTNKVELMQRYRIYLRSILDQFPWHPLNEKEYDYDAFGERLIKTIFMKEFQEVGYSL